MEETVKGESAHLRGMIVKDGMKMTVGGGEIEVTIAIEETASGITTTGTGVVTVIVPRVAKEAKGD